MTAKIIAQLNEHMDTHLKKLQKKLFTVNITISGLVIQKENHKPFLVFMILLMRSQWWNNVPGELFNYLCLNNRLLKTSLLNFVIANNKNV